MDEDEGRVMDGDRVVFPDDSGTVTPYSVPSATNSPSTGTSSSTVAIVVVMVVVALACLLAAAAYFYRRRRKKKEEEVVKEELGAKVSVKTLGSHYEVESLLSINTVDREGVPGDGGKYKMEGAIDVTDGINGVKNGHVHHLNVTKYIDSELGASQDGLGVKGGNVKHQSVKGMASTYLDASSQASSKTITPHHSRRSSMITMDEIVTLAEGYMAKPSLSLAPLAQEETTESRPVSSFLHEGSQLRLRNDQVLESSSSKTLNSSTPGLPGLPPTDMFPQGLRGLPPTDMFPQGLHGLPPTAMFPQIVSVSVQPPSPAPERPVSECLEKAPALPMKKKIESSSSEQNVNTRFEGSAGKADVNLTKSENSLLSSAPALPPKAKPLLPPKQAINKSREDVEKITKDMMRASSNILPLRKPINNNSDLKEAPKSEEIEEDYDFPSENKEIKEDEDYDDPSHSFNRTSEYEDYDNPSHTFN